MQKKYSIRTKTMLGTHHSWAVTMRSLLLYYIRQQHDCYLNSINGFSMCPKTWEGLCNKDIDNPDIDICYTAPKNFATRFKKNAKLKMAIYNYETDILPKEWILLHKHVDFILPSSNFSKEIFVQNGWPEEKCIVVPHGIHPEEYLIKDKQKLINDKKFRFLNVSIPHYRKNLDTLIEAYYNSFAGNEEVCLVIKTSLEGPAGRKRYSFEVDVQKLIKDTQQKYIKKGIKNLPQIEIFQDRVPSMVTMYNACDVLVSASSSEGFGLPLLEGLAANMLVIAPNATGQLDFLNKNNSLLVEVEKKKAGPKYQYWKQSDNAMTYFPKVDSLSEQMLNSYKNHLILKNNFQEEVRTTISKFTWEAASKKVLEIANENI